jgi:hypothetical protein
MIPVVLFGHGALAALCLVAGAFPRPIRARLTTTVALLGAALGGLQVALWESGEGWRTVSLDPAGAPIAGAAAMAAWAIVATSSPAEDRWWSGAFVGVSAMGLGMFASNDWLVPALLFWSASSIALIALLVRAEGGIAPVAAIVVSDALLIAAAAQGVLGDGNWTLPVGSGDGWFWLLAAAAIMRAGTIPLLAPGSARASLPLLAGGGLSIAAGIGEGSEPWLAAALVATAVLWAVLASTRRAPSIALPCATLAAVGLATIYAGAGAGGAAGIAVALGTGGLVLARASAGTALLVALVPLTPGFSALAAAAEVSFRGATEAPGTVASAPWTALAALLPVALAGAVAMGGRVVRSRSVDEDRSSRIAVAVLVAGAIVAGIAGIGARGDAGGDPLVLASALGAGCLAGAVSALRGGHLPVIGPEPFVVPTPHILGGRSARFAVVVLALVVLAELSTVALVTIEGLRTGFL